MSKNKNKLEAGKVNSDSRRKWYPLVPSASKFCSLDFWKPESREHIWGAQTEDWRCRWSGCSLGQLTKAVATLAETGVYMFSGTWAVHQDRYKLGPLLSVGDKLWGENTAHPSPTHPDPCCNRMAFSKQQHFLAIYDRLSGREGVPPVWKVVTFPLEIILLNLVGRIKLCSPYTWQILVVIIECVFAWYVGMCHSHGSQGPLLWSHFFSPPSHGFPGLNSGCLSDLSSKHICPVGHLTTTDLPFLEPCSAADLEMRETACPHEAQGLHLQAGVSAEGEGNIRKIFNFIMCLYLSSLTLHMSLAPN